MSATGYLWRQLNQKQREELLQWRKVRGHPWQWSSAAEYLARTGSSEAKRAWREYPIHEYGKNWDDPET